MISRITGIAIFLLIVILVNWLSFPGESPAADIATFLNQNVGLVVLFSLVFLAGEVIWELPFPVRILAPPTNAVGSVLLVTFFLRLLSLVDRITGTEIFGHISAYSPLILPLVFLAVLIAGIIALIIGSDRKGEGKREDQIG
ncbi:MAG: hypothetical protein RQ758_05465 [Methanomicrobiaceae archaeon]|nr:hypothetical protein [Methanomicrobiaceae archaeon]